MDVRGTILQSEIERLAAEVEYVYETIVRPGWGGQMHGLPDALYGYVMGALARIDLMSSYWHGSTSGSQTKRMLNFMDRYVGADRLATELLIQIWRHKLMHTSAPRPVTHGSTGRTYWWLLHWGDEHLPREQHLKIQPGGSILSLSLAGLIGDLRTMAKRYVTELSVNQELIEKYDAYDRSLMTGRF